MFFLKQEFIRAFTKATQLIYDQVFPKANLPIALSGGVIQAHPDIATECANMIFRGNPVSIFSSFAMPLSHHLANGTL
jgi:hypothetical protein